MKKLMSCTIFLGLIFASSHAQQANAVQIEQWKNELKNIELEFAKYAKDSGIAKAFEMYVADSGLINRNNILIKGKAAIRVFYNGNTTIKALNWTPDFADVSGIGDLGYTYGHYTATIANAEGDKEITGLFHTVWKRQKDGKWRFVWD